MSRNNVEKVIECFRAGRACKGDACSTDGRTIFSYAMPIAWHEGASVHVVPYASGPSATTRSQIQACQHAFGVREPAHHGEIPRAARRIDRNKLGVLMGPWGAGGDAIGAVGSYYYGGQVYPQKSFVERAVAKADQLALQADDRLHGWTKKDASELRKIASGLRYYLLHDYKSTSPKRRSANPVTKFVKKVTRGIKKAFRA